MNNLTQNLKGKKSIILVKKMRIVTVRTQVMMRMKPFLMKQKMMVKVLMTQNLPIISQ